MVQQFGQPGRFKSKGVGPRRVEIRRSCVTPEDFAPQERGSESKSARRTAVEITEVRIKLVEEAGERLQAFCSITFDNCFVIRDLKIIEGANGPFVAMPSRKLTAHCPRCGFKNHLRASYCSHCGQRQNDDRAIRDDSGRTKLYADIAHPINSSCR